MAYDPGAVESALAAAVGDEPRLIAELRGAFLESALLHLEALRVADSREKWQEAAGRMRGVAASFGARRLMDAAIDALTIRPMQRVCGGSNVRYRRYASDFRLFPAAFPAWMWRLGLVHPR